MVKLRARCLLVGDAAVGKSALAQMFRSEGAQFQKNYSMTTGVELLVKSINIPNTNDSVWGQPSVLCMVFDLTSEQSFTSCGRWMERVRAHCGSLHVPGVLVGNKLDLAERREVETTTAQDWAQSQGLDYHETSAKETENCERPFLILAQAFHSYYQEHLQSIQSLKPGPG